MKPSYTVEIIKCVRNALSLTRVLLALPVAKKLSVTSTFTRAGIAKLILMKYRDIVFH